jgi:hypothetical protein
MAAKQTRLIHKIAIQLHLVAEELHHLQFLLEAASPETFGYTLVRMSNHTDRQTDTRNYRHPGTNKLKKRATFQSHHETRPITIRCSQQHAYSHRTNGNQWSCHRDGVCVGGLVRK